MSHEIIALLNRSDRAVEKAMLRLADSSSLTAYDASGAKYYAGWIKSGRNLSGNHLPKARALAIRYAETLATMAQDKAPVAPTTMTLDREGEFTIETFGNAHCGTLKIQPVRYSLNATFDAVLDRRGFLADQLLVDRYFQGIKRSDLSCEKLCIQSLHHVRRVLLLDNPNLRIRSMKLTLSPAPYGAKMTCSL
jgi:hypothetical protein